MVILSRLRKIPGKHYLPCYLFLQLLLLKWSYFCKRLRYCIKTKSTFSLTNIIVVCNNPINVCVCFIIAGHVVA
jgi:hypothetical protein